MDQESGSQAEKTPNDFVFSTEGDVPEVKQEVKEPVKPEVTEDDQDLDDRSEKPKRRGGFQKKIERKDAEIAELNRKLAEFTKQDTSPKSDNATPGEPKPDDFANFDEYTKAQSKWTAENAIQEHEKAKDVEAKKKADQEHLQNRARIYGEGLEKGREAYTDFDEVLAEYEDVPINPAIRHALLEADNGAELAYHLGKDHELFDKLNQQTVGLSEVMRHLGRIEARLELAKETPAAVKTTNAPPPIKPIGKGKSAGTGFQEDMSPEDYAKWRRASKTR